mmetsp:Transcript_8307/g.24971  ORF Transcript_8307/g.24971 Transcript_8307/m.24971 type:complete len:312 (-) Transcript_8307:596-1531(-)|eukprot:CAMPEP_0198724816 /NCGR_PEP_ID=MMETSP1475-20131203/2229_1 /TAXON_ID= ORGANISM="Unidentified sp., Strain CCMP1999" /NCGR_SAMPLE_ID=MMETSP1475 /ASSEMBLY_ACC=CAM_ASM_001111 /LENGTH=311 /DNA_ID=CAMNT_0044486441 /DNA_START=55 /DNA_END=990 /DNA_ORIENTATION=-
MTGRSKVPINEAIFESCFTRLGVPVFFTIDTAPAPESSAEVSVPDERLVYGLAAQVVAQAPNVREVCVLALDRGEKLHRARYGNVTEVAELGIDTAEAHFEEAFDRLARPSSIVVIDSLSTLLHVEDLKAVAAAVIRSRKIDGFVGTVALWRSGSHTQSVRSAVLSLCTSSLALRMEGSQGPATGGAGYMPATGVRTGTVQLVRKKASGRVANTQLKATLTVRGNLQLESLEEASRAKEAVREPGDALRDLQVPFNLALTEDERRARSQVTLAYEHEDEDRADRGLDLHPEQLQADYIDDPEQDSGDDIDV